MLEDRMRVLIEREIIFLKMVIAELRSVANEAPEIADRVRQIVLKIELDAADLEREIG